MEQNEPLLPVQPPPAHPGAAQRLVRARRLGRAGEDEDRERVGAMQAGGAGGSLALGQCGARVGPVRAFRQEWDVW